MAYEDYRCIEVTSEEADILLTLLSTGPRAHRMRGVIDQLEDLRHDAWFHATNYVDDKWHRDNAHLLNKKENS